MISFRFNLSPNHKPQLTVAHNKTVKTENVGDFNGEKIIIFQENRKWNVSKSSRRFDFFQNNSTNKNIFYEFYRVSHPKIANFTEIAKF